MFFPRFQKMPAGSGWWFRCYLSSRSGCHLFGSLDGPLKIRQVAVLAAFQRNSLRPSHASGTGFLVIPVQENNAMLLNCATSLPDSRRLHARQSTVEPQIVTTEPECAKDQ